MQMNFKNWIEITLKKRILCSPVYVGSKGGRKLYSINFEDGTEKDFYIDFDNQEIDEY